MSEYIKAQDVFYENVIKAIKKAQDPLRPLYEVIANALESISSSNTKKGAISISLFYGRALNVDRELQKISIEDNGGGFTDESFDRFKRWGDNRKGPTNRGTGRAQLLHSFKMAKYESTYSEGSTWKKRTFSLSKAPIFLAENAIVRLDSIETLNEGQNNTRVDLIDCVSEKDREFFSVLTPAELKDKIISHFLLQFVLIRDSMPGILISEYFGGEQKGEPLQIDAEDIPKIDNEKDFIVNYMTLDEKGRLTQLPDQFETFHLTCFRIASAKCKANSLRLTSNGQLVAAKVKLECIRAQEEVAEHRFIFLISSDYLNARDTDSRGEFKIRTGDELKEQNTDVPDACEPEIILDSLVENANTCIINSYAEIKASEEQKVDELSRLKDMFLLSPEIIKSVSITRSDTDESILTKIYRAEAKISAKYDSAIKSSFDRLEALDASSANFNEELESIVDSLSDEIPAKNKYSVARYIARRQLVLELFDKVLKRKTTIQQTQKRNIDERLLHNIIFRQGSKDSQASDLWILNEEFLYFDGSSESTIFDLTVGGKKIIKDPLTEAEQDFCKKISGNKGRRKPDIFLYPEEGKCILVELKNPNVNVSEHLNQITLYSGILRNLTSSEFEISSFYGYLIGEEFDLDDVRTYDSDFKYSPKFNFVFRPSKPVFGRFGRKDGELYTEVIKYSEIHRRAQLRNSIFAKKLGVNLAADHIIE